MIGTVYGFENRKTVETVRKKNYGFGYGVKTVQNRKEKNLRFCNFCLRLQNRMHGKKFTVLNRKFTVLKP